MSKFIIMLNGGTYFKGSKNVFSKKELDQIIEDEFQEGIKDQDGGKLNIDCLMDQTREVCGGMLEYGDDFCDFGIVELCEE